MDRPPPSAPGPATRLLRRARDGDREAFDRLFELLYDELRSAAHAQRGRWSGDYTLNTTALVHEAYMKLVGGEEQDWSDRGHFLAVASKAMRHILVNYAERRRAQKRGGEAEKVPLDEAREGEAFNPVPADAAEELIALDLALRKLEVENDRHARVVECRFFGGLPVEETARVLGISPATVKRDWKSASAWLHKRMVAG